MKSSKKGIRSHISAEMIREYLKIPPVQRLMWLQDAAILTSKCLTPSRKKIYERFRNGTL